MDSVLFNLYTCLVMEPWITGTDCQYADDTALLSTTRSGAMRSMTEYINLRQVKILVYH